MARVLLVTNDFPPRRGGIQSYLENLVRELVHAGTHTLTVYAPKWAGAEEFDAVAAADGYDVVRHPTTLDGARAVGGGADAAADRPPRHRHRVVRGGGAAGAAFARWPATPGRAG